jgi:hypothetical protein
MKKSILIILLALTVLSCTENQRSRSFGGDQTINLKAGHRLVTATWKQDNLWYLTEPMPENYAPKTVTFQENSSYGVWEGKVTFIETR